MFRRNSGVGVFLPPHRHAADAGGKDNLPDPGGVEEGIFEQLAPKLPPQGSGESGVPPCRSLQAGDQGLRQQRAAVQGGDFDKGRYVFL